MTKEKVFIWKKSEKQKVIELIKKYKQKLGLNLWSFEIKFLDGKVDTINRVKDSIIVNAEVVSDSVYERAVVKFYPNIIKLLREGNLESAEGAVKHEICHCLTQEVYDLGQDRYTTEKTLEEAVERLTQRISRLI